MQSGSAGDPHTYCYGDSVAHNNCVTFCYSHAHCNAYAHSYPNANSHAYGNSYNNTPCDTNRDPNGNSGRMCVGTWLLDKSSWSVASNSAAAW